MTSVNIVNVLAALAALQCVLALPLEKPLQPEYAQVEDLSELGEFKATDLAPQLQRRGISMASMCVTEAFLKKVQNPWERSGKFEGDIVLDAAADQIAAIHRGIDEFHQRTCIRLRPRTASDIDYVRVQGLNSGCWSMVGRRGRVQDLNLQPGVPGSGCFRHGTIVHEFLHALGFYHEQSSSDRDDYVTIVWANIQAGTENNFAKHSASTVTNYGIGYDYDSVLHYGPFAFSINGEMTIVPHDPTAVLGQRVAMSEKDVLKLNTMYQCNRWFAEDRDQDK
ncbi:unnamed protein product [Timema podura]|uniref:Metalloendopeptidase n=1 Tax=Timema podura TaxID=61482 RepID=A0ABN7NIB4_TIMPD|nr:unnamed protein product [Timema podura]